jgi:NADH-quinone oxidoreductase subunit M
MSELHLPWLEAAILIPLVGAAVVCRMRNADQARLWAMCFTGLAFVCAVGTWQDFHYLQSSVNALQADDRWHLFRRLFGREVLVVDQLSAPLLPLVALLYFLTTLTTLRTKIRRFSFGWSLLSQGIILGVFSCTEPWGIIGLLAVGTIPPFLELRFRGKPTRVYVLHMLLYVGMMVIGWSFAQFEVAGRVHSLWAVVPLLLAVLVRNGIAPFHCWMTDLFEHATFGTAILFVTPITGAYLAVRLLLPIAPDWVLQCIGLLSLVTAVYAASMALIQRDARRFFCFLFLSHSALVLVGLEIDTPIGLTGALCVWLSVSLALGGFGLTMRAIESRCGRLSLSRYQGLYEHTPVLAMLFMLTGLASIGFPGTFGFVGTELLVEGAIEAYPYIGVAVVIAAAINSIAIVHAYFVLFTGTRYASSVTLQIRKREQYAMLALALIILLGGLFPRPGVVSRHHAAVELLKERSTLAAEAVGVNGDTTAKASIIAARPE